MSFCRRWTFLATWLMVNGLMCEPLATAAVEWPRQPCRPRSAHQEPENDVKIKSLLRPSLMNRALLLLVLLLVLFLVRNVAVLSFTWLGLHDTNAIDTASALRTEVNQLIRKVGRGEPVERQQQLLASLDAGLHDEQLQLALERPGREHMRATFLRLQDMWNLRLSEALRQGDSAEFLLAAESFATDLDDLATSLQHQHNHLHLLDLVQVLFLALVLPLLYFMAFFWFRRRVDVPLKKLVAATDQFRAGNFDVRMDYQSRDEIGLLATAFNSMAETVGASHRSLEGRVEAKMQRLGQANAALELLFRSSHSVAEQPLGAEALEELVRRFQVLLPGLQLTLCLEPPAANPGGSLIALHGIEDREFCAKEQCGSCEHHIARDQQVFAVRSQGQLLGKLRARFHESRPSQQWEGELLQALADLVGSALMLGRQREQGNQLLLLAERNTIARELHDSLAQSLSYMKLQVSRLQALIQKGEDCHAVESVAVELREGINDAYRQLRELLTTFRLGIGTGDLTAAMKDAATEFAGRGGFSVTLAAEPLAVPLSANEQIDLLQIMREALANCSRHAQAEKVNVALRQQGEEVELLIDDDGQGISSLSSQRHHHGITIMQERAGSIRGTIEIVGLQPRGTRVRLAFRPTFLSA
jgi:two-component system nitrate/nitrite sensor histidine kinase NarX